MPCRDPGIETAEHERNRENNIVAPAGLCAVLTVLEREGLYGTVIDRIDWQEAGIERWRFEKWWENHKREDEIRRAKEAQQAQEEEIRRRAYEKLTQEERDVLGFY